MKTGTLLTVKITLVPMKYHLHFNPKGKTSIPTKQIFRQRALRLYGIRTSCSSHENPNGIWIRAQYP